jgi:hypothetical protein
MQTKLVRFTAAFGLLGAAALARAATLDNLPPWDTGRGTINYGTDRDAVAASDPLPPWDLGRGKVVPRDEAVADVEPVDTTPVAEVPATDTVGAADGRNDPCTPIATSPDAVGHPCETTRSFMQSLGMTEAQIARVESISVSTTAH